MFRSSLNSVFHLFNELSCFLIFTSSFAFSKLYHSRFPIQTDLKDSREWKEAIESYYKNRDVKTNTSVPVLASLSYRKKSHLDFVEGKGDTLLRSLEKKAESDDESSIHRSRSKTKLLNQKCHDNPYSTNSKRTYLSLDDLSGRQSVISQANSEANSGIRKGTDSLWGQVGKETSNSLTKLGSSSTSPERNLKNKIHPGSSLGLSAPHRHSQSISRLDRASSSRSLCGSPPSSSCFSRRSRSQTPGSVSQLDFQVSIGGSCCLRDVGIYLDKNGSVAPTKRSINSLVSSTGRSSSMPPPLDKSTSANQPIDTSDIRPVSHQNYHDHDLEKAINEVPSFKPIKFKRRSLEDCEEEERSRSDRDESQKIENEERIYSTRSLRCSESAVDCMRSSCSASSYSHHHGSKSKRKNKNKKKTRSHSSETDSSGDSPAERSSSQIRTKNSPERSKEKDKYRLSSTSSESNYSSSSDASTISYRSYSSVKKSFQSR